MPPAVRRLRHVLPVTGSSAPGAPLSLGRSVGRRQDYPDLVADTFFFGHFGRHAARCLHVGAGFQPAHEPPRAWTLRRLKTCGHFSRQSATSGNLWPTQKRRRGRHPRGCRPRSGACVTFFLSPGLPLPGPLQAGARLRSQSGLPRFGGCHLFHPISPRSRRRPPRGSDAASAAATLRGPLRCRPRTPCAWARGRGQSQ